MHLFLVHIEANKEKHSCPGIREKFSSEEKSSFETFSPFFISCSVNASYLAIGLYMTISTLKSSLISRKHVRVI
jgi:hypothetical protein